MTFEWASVAFAEICEHSAFGPRFGGDQYAKDGNVATLRTTDISAEGRIEYDTMPLARLDLERFRNHILRVNDLVITRSGRIGTASVFKGFHLPVLPGAFLLRFRLDTAVADPFFYQYFFNSPAGQSLLRSVASGSVQQNLNITAVHQIRVPRPPLAQQRAIVRILRSLDDKIELNRSINETLEATARALFKSWFIDFDPVRTKMEGHESAPSKFADLFPDAFEDSELGEIPKGWTLRSIEDLAEIAGGSTPSTKEPSYWDGMHHWATPKDLSSLTVPVLLETERSISDEGLAQISSGLLPAGTVLLSSRAPIGYLAISEVPVAINQGFIAMRAKRNVSNLFLLFWAHFSQETIVSRANGSTFLEISKANFRRIPVITPTQEVLAAFDVNVRPLYNKIVANELQSRMLADLRNTLVPKLIAGELRISNPEGIPNSQ